MTSFYCLTFLLWCSLFSFIFKLWCCFVYLSQVIAGICVLVWVVNIGHFRDPAHGGFLRGAIHYFKVCLQMNYFIHFLTFSVVLSADLFFLSLSRFLFATVHCYESFTGIMLESCTVLFFMYCLLIFCLVPLFVWFEFSFIVSFLIKGHHHCVLNMKVF